MASPGSPVAAGAHPATADPAVRRQPRRYLDGQPSATRSTVPAA